MHETRRPAGLHEDAPFGEIAAFEANYCNLHNRVDCTLCDECHLRESKTATKILSVSRARIAKNTR